MLNKYSNYSPLADIKYKESKEALKFLIESLSIKRAEPGKEFTLASGAKSTFYLDLRLATLSPDALPHIVHCIYYLLLEKRVKYDAIGGPAVGAIPIIGGLTYFYGLCGFSDPPTMFFVRKEQKDHGTKKLVEGDISEGQRAIIIEDVTTSGGSAADAIVEARKVGLLVDYVVCIVDRQSGGAEMLKKEHNVTLLPLFTKADFGL